MRRLFLFMSRLVKRGVQKKRLAILFSRLLFRPRNSIQIEKKNCILAATYIIDHYYLLDNALKQNVVDDEEDDDNRILNSILELKNFDINDIMANKDEKKKKKKKKSSSKKSR